MVATRALTEDLVEMEFLTDGPVAQAVSYQRVSQDHISVYEVTAAPAG